MSRRFVPPFVVGLDVVLLAVAGLALSIVGAGVGNVFPGFIVSERLVVTQLNQPYWGGIRTGLRPGDVILAIDGDPVSTATSLRRRVSAAETGTSFRYAVARGGERFERAIRSAVFTPADFLSTFGILAATGLAFLAVGSAVFWIRRDVIGAGLYGLTIVIAFATLVSPGVSWGFGVPLGRVRTLLMLAGVLHLAAVFPEPARTLAARPWLAALPYLVALVVGVAGLTIVSDAGLAARVEWLNRWTTFALAAAFLAVVARTVWTRKARERRAPRMVAQAAMLAVACYGTGFLGAEFGWIPSAPASVFVVPAWIWLVAVFVASLRDDAFGLGPGARRSLVAPVTHALTAVFHLALFGVVLLALRATGETGAWIPAVVFLALAVVLADPFRKGAAALVARLMDGPVVLSSKGLRAITADLSSSREEEGIVDVVLDLPNRISIGGVRLFLAADRGFVEARGSTCLSPDDPLVEALREHDTAVVLAETQGGPADETLARLGITLALPLRERGGWCGILGVRTRPRGRRIGRDDVAAFATVAGQIAVALGNARAFRRILDLEAELRAENVVLREELAAKTGPAGLVGQSPPMQALYGAIEQVAPTDGTVLLLGETGTGKELVARAIHARSLRHDRPMIRVNCAAMHPSLLESELFGHERGSFTGAVSRKIGRFELAQGGTIFLDEIAELPPALQAKLLRVLQEREFERVGGSSVLRADVRVLAATNRDLESLVRRGRFREDLYHRLDVFPIVVPPLRGRREDIPALVAHFLRRDAARAGKPVTSIEERSLRALQAYRWPGNVRELENVIERAVILSSGDRLVVRDLEPPAAGTPRPAGLRRLSEILRDVKVGSIQRALERTSGNQAQAAELLRMKPSSLSRMMKSLGLRGER